MCIFGICLSIYHLSSIYVIQSTILCSVSCSKLYVISTSFSVRHILCLCILYLKYILISIFTYEDGLKINELKLVELRDSNRAC